MLILENKKGLKNNIDFYLRDLKENSKLNLKLAEGKK